MAQLLKYVACVLIVFVSLLHILSCSRQESTPAPIPLADSVAQNPSYRLGTWYSVTDSGSVPGYNHNTKLDTIWFINDSIAGWSGFGGNPYVYWPTYFSDPYHIVYVAPDPINTSKLDTDVHECGMTTKGDTFVVYWQLSNFQLLDEHYLKVKN